MQANATYAAQLQRRAWHCILSLDRQPYKLAHLLPMRIHHPDYSPRTITMASTLNTIVSYLRLPFLATSGVATLLSGLLYFKQK